MSIGNMSLNSNHALTKENFVANSEKRADRVQPSTTGVFSMAGSSCHGERNEKAAPEEDNLALVPDSVPEPHGRALPFIVETDMHPSQLIAA
jgi:hypothetical protein